jgi:hypothetical protein
VYSQELNKIMKPKKSGAGTNDFYKPKLAAGDIYGILYLMRPTAS